jgi:muramoyltetrapeptide carboxypeptidase
MMSMNEVLMPQRLEVGDKVRLISPATAPSEEILEHSINVLEGLGLVVEIGKHALDRHGYLAGTDEDRLADLNDALRNPEIKAVFTTRGGRGAYRIADGIDFEAARQNPKLIVGFSENTILHLAILKHCNIPGLHGAPRVVEGSGRSAESFKQALFTTEPIVIKTDTSELTAELTTQGRAEGVLIGGNQDLIATAAGWMLPDFKDAILLLEAVDMRIGQIDRQLTMLKNAGHLDGIKGIAIGQYTDCGESDGWTSIDVLRDRLSSFGVPILGGLPIGHGKEPMAVPIGTHAILDADGGTLTVVSSVG